MIQTAVQVEAPPLLVKLEPVIHMTDDEFFLFCQLNRDLRIERNAQGEITLMSPASWETSRRNLFIAFTLYSWSIQNGTGVASESSGGFVLPNKTVFAPDAAWVRRERLTKIPQGQKRKFLPLAPDFVIELRSPSDRLQDLQAKMAEYITNGVQLGWLIDPDNRQVFVYQANTPPEQLMNPSTLAGDPLLPGFILDLNPIWELDL